MASEKHDWCVVVWRNLQVGPWCCQHLKRTYRLFPFHLHDLELFCTQDLQVPPPNVHLHEASKAFRVKKRNPRHSIIRWLPVVKYKRSGRNFLFLNLRSADGLCEFQRTTRYSADFCSE